MRNVFIATAATAVLFAAVPALAQEESGSTEAVAEDGAQTVDVQDDAEPVLDPSVADVGSPESATTETEASAPASADAQTVAASREASGELPDEVKEVIADGRYTTDDLNRAQLAALQGGES